MLLFFYSAPLRFRQFPRNTCDTCDFEHASHDQWPRVRILLAHNQQRRQTRPPASSPWLQQRALERGGFAGEVELRISYARPTRKSGELRPLWRPCSPPSHERSALLDYLQRVMSVATTHPVRLEVIAGDGEDPETLELLGRDDDRSVSEIHWAIDVGRHEFERA